jgi:cystathionine beta-lyase family protein involved in aluminum resistance
MKILDRFGISNAVQSLVTTAESCLLIAFKSVEETAEYNQYKVIDAFRANRISARHFAPTTGYGYSDEGRQALCDVFAAVTKAQGAVLSPHIVSGTHAISLALYAVLRPLDTLIGVSGKPYDTLRHVIGSKGRDHDTGSLADLAVDYRQVELQPDGSIDIARVENTIRSCERPKALFLQRSRGYEWRRAISMLEIKEFSLAIKRQFPDIIIIVDNCYGEFCEIEEPIEAGADLIAGSMIKNPGGGLAPTGGYIAGRADLISQVENRMTCPGLGIEVGSYEASYRSFFQGLFMAPHIVGEALKGSILCAKVFETLGYNVFPLHDDSRSDITQSIMLNNEALLLAYTRGIQKAAAIDSHVIPTPWDMPGYDDPIVMAAGTFVQGASIELSADAPVKPPYIVYAQGGLSYAHMKLGLMFALTEMNII